jgi:hypothetical protein
MQSAESASESDPESEPEVKKKKRKQGNEHKTIIIHRLELNKL